VTERHFLNPEFVAFAGLVTVSLLAAFTIGEQHTEAGIVIGFASGLFLSEMSDILTDRVAERTEN
jgi:hypothetical protein